MSVLPGSIARQQAVDPVNADSKHYQAVGHQRQRTDEQQVADGGLLVAWTLPAGMLLIRGRAGGTALTGTLYEPGERAPTFQGAPDESAPYTWVCDGFYEVESGGQLQEIDGREVRVAFEEPLSRGFETRQRAIEAAKEHVRTQFVRLGVPAGEVGVEVMPIEPAQG